MSQLDVVALFESGMPSKRVMHCTSQVLALQNVRYPGIDAVVAAYDRSDLVPEKELLL